jgi:predicted ATP-binding protein involved in virulence
MPLRKLVIENVRSIEHVEIDFSTPDDSRKWTVLLGENGTGKTTILRCAALVLAGSDALGELLKEPGTWVRNGAEAASITADFTTRDGELRQASLAWSSQDSRATIVRKNEANLQALDAALEHTSRNYFVAAFGSSRRLPARDSPAFQRGEVFSAPRSQAVATLFSRDATLQPVEAWAMDLDYRRSEGSEGVEIVRSALDALLPDVKFSHIDRERREIIFTTPDGPVPLDRLSDGYQNMAGWVGDFLFRLTETFGDYRSPLDAGGLLLIDEVDLHLHPMWQRQILKFLDDKLHNFQFLVTTHSPFTAHQSPEGALHIVQRNSAGSPELRQYAADPRLLRVEQLLDPLLGLSTADSVETESLKNEYRDLKALSSRTPEQEQRFHELAAKLADRPEAQAITPDEKERLQVLKNVEKLLANR